MEDGAYLLPADDLHDILWRTANMHEGHRVSHNTFPGGDRRWQHGTPTTASSTGPHLKCVMTMRVPAAVAMRAAVSLVAMPPVPHCVPRVLVSTCMCVQKKSGA